MGLLGLATNTRFGGAIDSARVIAGTEMSQSASRGTSSTRWPRTLALSLYITNVGVVVSSVGTVVRPRGWHSTVSNNEITSSLPTPTRTSSSLTAERAAMAARSFRARGSG